MAATRASLLCTFSLACTLGSTAAALPVPPVLPVLAPVPARELRVTTGQLEGQGGAPLGANEASNHFWVRSPALRAWVGHRPRSSVELELVYLGPTRSQAPLASGQLRRQIGLELRAQDGCNLLYVMWRIEPVQALMVSLKSNPGQRQHRECRDRGYVNLEPEHSLPLAPLRAGERHVLRASASASELEVWVDGRSHWRGRLPALVASIDGPVGVRSDNGEFELQLRSAEPVQ
ncbi:MAG: hypothetical protein RL685_6816 [Pseudomonadota bacterium]|jgi:hypothetical protein